MWPRRSCILALLTEADSVPKGGKILWDDALEDSFKELKRVVSAETLLSYTYWKIPFTVNTDASDKHAGSVISQNNKPISFFSLILSKTQRNYTNTKRGLIVIVEFLKQFCIIIFG